MHHEEPNRLDQEKPGPAEAEASLSPETEKGEIIERAQEERLEILEEHFSSLAKEVGEAEERTTAPGKNLGSTALDFFIGNYKMAIEAIAGKTLAGSALSPKDRLLYGIAAGTGILAHICGVAGVASEEHRRLLLETGAVSYGISWATFSIERIPKIADDLRNIASRYSLPKLEKMAETAREVLSSGGRALMQKITDRLKPSG
ncbi:MAG: hypothetical protein AAB495_04360 [Patescibacteria group bacterium]